MEFGWVISKSFLAPVNIQLCNTQHFCLREFSSKGKITQLQTSVMAEVFFFLCKRGTEIEYY